MHSHHADTIERVRSHFERDPNVLALLLSGSIAHEFESEDSDVDILIIVTEAEFQKHVQTGETTFFSTDLCTYKGGYVDGKFLSLSFIRNVAEKGSEPARFAFDGVQILFSRVNNLDHEIKKVVTYPLQEKVERIVRFRAQLEAWNWYCGEARKKTNNYLLGVAAGKLILFAGRLILAHNEILYPYHKWLIKVLEKASEKPSDLLDCIQRVSVDPSLVNTNSLYETVKTFRDWEQNPRGWGPQFMMDSELNWIDGKTPVDDL